MIFGLYTLDVLVNGVPLPEFNQPLKDLKIPISTSPSCVFDESTCQWNISDTITWVQVPQPDTYFTVRFSSSSVSPWFPLMAYLVIDGQLDYRYMEMYNTGFHLRDHFVSSDKSTKYFFKFNNSVWSDECKLVECNNNSIKYGGIGAISMYFYRARPINEVCEEMPNVEIKQPILPGGNSTDIKITTGFDTIFNYLGSVMPNMNYLQSLYCVPVGILHLHYRSASWFSNLFKFPIDAQYDNKLPITKATTSHDLAENMMVKVNQETGNIPVKHRFQCSGLAIKQELEDKRSVMVMQGPDQGIETVSLTQENKDIKQEIKELNSSLKVETTMIKYTNSLQHKKMSTKLNDSERIHKKNENGKGIKKNYKQNFHCKKRMCKPMQSHDDNTRIYN